MNSRISTPIFSFLLFSILSIALVGCSSNSSGTDPDGDNGGPGATEVGMSSQAFSPANIEIKVGTTVKWTNGSSVTHTVTSGTNGEHDDEFDSGNLAPGASFSHTFDEIGEFPYYCIPHLNAGMTGSVTVVDGN